MILKILYFSALFNVVTNYLSQLFMGDVSHIYEAKKDLVKDAHRLATFCVRLEDSLNDGFMFHNNLESSLVVEVRSK